METEKRSHLTWNNEKLSYRIETGHQQCSFVATLVCCVLSPLWLTPTFYTSKTYVRWWLTDWLTRKLGAGLHFEATMTAKTRFSCIFFSPCTNMSNTVSVRLLCNSVFRYQTTVQLDSATPWLRLATEHWAFLFFTFLLFTVSSSSSARCRGGSWRVVDWTIGDMGQQCRELLQQSPRDATPAESKFSA